MSSTVKHRNLDKEGHSRSSRSGFNAREREREMHGEREEMHGEREGGKERVKEREGHGFPTVMYSTDQTQPYEKKTGSRSAFCVHLGSAMADPGLIVSRTQADPEQTLISGVDLGATKKMSKYLRITVRLEYSRGWHA